MNELFWQLLTPTSPSTCDTSWQPFLVSLSPALCALLSATALWVGARARSISRDALATSQGAVTLSMLATPSPLDMGHPEPTPGPEKR